MPRHVLAAGADPRLASSSGITALDLAKHFKHPSVVALLEAKLAELRASSSSK